MTDARRAALSALIDHAPLFPPASLPLPQAVEEDRRARADEHAWVLARLVWPASRLGDLGAEGRALSVLLDETARVSETQGRFVEALETRWQAGLDGLEGEVYVELPLDDLLEERVAELAARGLRAKVRCGGAAVPSVESLGAFLRACRAARVPFKATAGLHHPLAGDGRHGFLNVLAACAFGDEDALGGEVGLTPEALRWRNREAGPEELARVRREQLVAVGSCSFFEPVGELKALGIL